MKKFFIFCLMAFMVCACDKTPRIQKEIFTTYYGEMLFDDIIPTDKVSTQVYEYDTRGNLIFMQLSDSEDFIYAEETISYKKDERISCHRWVQFDKDSERTEHLWYKENGKWYRNTNGEITQLNDSENEQLNQPSDYITFLPVNTDGTFTIIEDRYQCIGKVVETDKYGNWVKAIGKEKYDYESSYLDDRENYVVYTREIVYY